MFETLVNILNIFWYIFSILFVLYKFTSFFSHLYNFFQFCKKISDGIMYIGNKTRNYSQYKYDEESPCVNVNSTKGNSFFNNFKETVQNLYKSEQDELQESGTNGTYEMTEQSYVSQLNENENYNQQYHPLQKNFSKNLNNIFKKQNLNTHFKSKGNWLNKEGITNDEVESIINEEEEQLLNLN